jgi:hypothetical protein
MEELAMNDASLNNSLAKAPQHNKFTNSVRNARSSICNNSIESSRMNNNEMNLTSINLSHSKLLNGNYAVNQSINNANNKKDTNSNINNTNSTKKVQISTITQNKNSLLSMLDLNSDLNLSSVSNGTTVNYGNQTTINDLIHKLARTDEKNFRKKVTVTTRIVFLKMGQIDTINERYDANVYIESSWEDDVIFKILADPKMSQYGKTLLVLKC